jgi:hypothetical protein
MLAGIAGGAVDDFREPPRPTVPPEPSLRPVSYERAAMTDNTRSLRNLAGITDARCNELRLSLANVRTLGDLMEWGRTRHPPAQIDEIITQDEYTHDVLMLLDAPEWLAFDVT